MDIVAFDEKFRFQLETKRSSKKQMFIILRPKTKGGGTSTSTSSRKKVVILIVVGERQLSSSEKFFFYHYYGTSRKREREKERERLLQAQKDDALIILSVHEVVFVNYRQLKEYIALKDDMQSVILQLSYTERQFQTAHNKMIP